MNELEINAKFNALIDQRNNAMNQVVNLLGELAVAQAKINALESKAVELAGQDESNDSDSKTL